jgi:N-acetylglucosaminyldiphosphoundecaprenol N-acetyl-beta-D-mannosaminyltransferase
MINRFTLQEQQFLIGNSDSVTSYIVKLIETSSNKVILPCSLNDMAMASENDYWSKIYCRVSYCLTDGMPLVWYFNFKYSLSCERVYGPDLMRDILNKSQSLDVKHFFYGASKDTLFNLKNNVKKAYPKINIEGMISPPYRKLTIGEEANYLNKIKLTNSNVLWIGLSSPKQVELAVRWQKLLPGVTIMCVGAAFDFIAGSKVSAPSIIQRVGLEWLFRLITEPSRLYKRYLIQIPKFILKELFLLF